MHPTWEQLVDYGDKRLTPEEAEQVNAHLATCATCDAEVEWLDRTTNSLRAVSFTAPPRALRLAAEDLFAQRLGGASPAIVAAPPIAPAPAPRGRVLRVDPAVWQRARWVGAAIAALLVVAFFVQQRQSTPMIAAVQEVQGDVQVERNAGVIQPLTTADTVREGDLLTTATNGTAQVSFAEGAVRVTMLGDSRLRYEDDNSADASLRLATDTSGDLEITVTGPPAVELATPVMVLRMEQGIFRTHYLTPRTLAVRVIEGTLTAITQDGASYTFTAGDDHIWQLDPQSGNIVPVPITDATPTPTATVTPMPSATTQATASRAPATPTPRPSATATTQSTATPPATATAIPTAMRPIAPSPSRVPALVASATPTLPLMPPTDDNSGSGSGGDDNSGSGSSGDDNSGSGSGDDDNSGSGSGGDDNSGSGSGGDDNSGSGSGGDDNSGSGSGGDDNSGSGSGSDDNSGSGSGDDDNSGSGSGSDDNSGSGSGGDDNSGSGSGGDDNSDSGSGGDDNSGSGSGGDDNSGSGSGGDDNSGSGEDDNSGSGGDDNSGSGSGGDDNSDSGSGGDDNSGSGSGGGDNSGSDSND